MSSNQYELENAPSDLISAVKFSPQSPTKLLVSSWDKNVYLYDIEGSGQVLRKFEHRAPVLDVCFGHNDEIAYSCGLDWDVRRIDLETGNQEVLSSHSAPAASLVYSPQTQLLISGSWDSTLHIHIPSSSQPSCTVQLPSKPYSLSLSPTKLVVAMASRNVYIYGLTHLLHLCKQAHAQPGSGTDEIVINAVPIQERESSLKFQIRSVACMANDLGYATSSIEGRIAVDWFDESEEVQKKKYAFKCHRNTENDIDVVYPVHALAFHPVHQLTFASGGGDGTVSLWDGSGKRRIKQLPTFKESVAGLAFSNDGRYLAVGVSPELEDGKDFDVSPGDVKIYIRELVESDVKGKGAK